MVEVRRPNGLAGAVRLGTGLKNLATGSSNAAKVARALAEQVRVQEKPRPKG